MGNAMTVCRSHDDSGNVRQEWLDERKRGVTATDVAKLMTGGSWIKAWAKKTGRIESEDLSDIEYVHWGNVMERVILEQYSTDRYSGRPVKPSGELMRSKQYPFLQATLDARTEHPEHGWIPLDAKNTGAHMEERWSEGAPPAYLWQIRTQAIVEGTHASSIACAIGGNKLIWADDQLNEAHARAVLETAERFWWYVENDIPPDADASEDTKLALNSIYQPNANEVIKLGADFAELDIEWADLKATLATRAVVDRELQGRITEIENKLKRAMGNHGVAQLPTGVVWTLETKQRKSYTVNPKPANVLKRVVKK